MSPALPRLLLSFDSVEALQAEFRSNLRTGGAFLRGVSGYEERTACQLVLQHPVSKRTLELPAEVVYVRSIEPGLGVGVQLADFGPAVLQKVRSFVEEASEEPATVQSGTEPQAEPDGAAPETQAQKTAATALNDRLKSLSVAAQQKMAREGTLPERVALERIYGKAVWEALLHNQRVTPPEVARIARMGLVPAALLDFIVGNAAWLGSGEVRRALLSNPRLPEESLLRVLRATPRPELQLIANQTQHSPRIRKAAKALTSKG